jgi:hypothetical protein
MGIVKWFLRIHFFWHIMSTTIAVHLNQSGSMMRTILPPRPHLIAPGYPSTQSRLHLISNVKKPIKVWLVVWVGSLTRLGLTLLLFIPSSLLTVMNLLLVTWKRHSTPFILFTHTHLWDSLHIQWLGTDAFLHPLSSVHGCWGLHWCYFSHAS